MVCSVPTDTDQCSSKWKVLGHKGHKVIFVTDSGQLVSSYNANIFSLTHSRHNTVFFSAHMKFRLIANPFINRIFVTEVASASGISQYVEICCAV